MEESIIVKKQPKSIIAESYRSIRSSIQFSNVDNNITKIMFTSAIPGEGKTTTAINTAYSMAEIGKKVLLIDLDLRKPTVHRKLKISNQYGVTDILLNKVSYDKYVQKLSDNFHVITAGAIPKNPSEIMSSQSMLLLLETVSEDYDYIFMDCSPMLVTDPIVLSRVSDGVIYVVESGSSDIEISQRNTQKLKAANANILGCVLNKIDKKTSRYGSNYNYAYY